jgi:hypothetical protein
VAGRAGSSATFTLKFSSAALAAAIVATGLIPISVIVTTGPGIGVGSSVTDLAIVAGAIRRFECNYLQLIGLSPLARDMLSWMPARHAHSDPTHRCSHHEVFEVWSRSKPNDQ